MPVYTESQFLLSGNNYSGNIEIDSFMESSGSGQVDFMLFSSNGGAGINGYLFMYDSTVGVQAARIYRLDNGTPTDISTYGIPVNASQLTGAQSMKAIYYAMTGFLLFFLNGGMSPAAQAIDKTYAVNGPVGTLSEGVPGFIDTIKISSPSPAQSGSNLVSSQGSILNDPDIATSFITGLKVTGISAWQGLVVYSGRIAVESTGYSFAINPWTVGPNGIDSGSPGPSTGYYVYVIYNGTNYAGLVSASSTPSLPSGYTYSKLISWFATDPSGFILGYYQWGTDVYLSVAPQWTTTSASKVVIDPSAYMPVASGLATNGIFAMGVTSYSAGNVGTQIYASGSAPLGIWCMTPEVNNANFTGPFPSFSMPIIGLTIGFAKTGSGTGNATVWLYGFRLSL